MEDVTRELEHRRRITSIYTKTRDDFPSKDAFDDYLEAVEDIIYKLTSNIDVAEVEQQVQDYVRQEAAALPAATDSAAPAYISQALAGPGKQPAPLTQVQQDAEGRILPLNPPVGREQWQRMARAGGWTQEIAKRRALEDAFSAIFVF